MIAGNVVNKTEWNDRIREIVKVANKIAADEALVVTSGNFYAIHSGGYHVAYPCKYGVQYLNGDYDELSTGWLTKEILKHL